MNSCLTRRLVAFLIDVALAYGIYFLLGAPESPGVDPPPLLLFLTWLLRVVPELFWRRSPGKMILRIDALGPAWAPPVRHSWLILPVPLGMVFPAIPWYSLFVLLVGASAVLSPTQRSVADRLTRSTVVQQSQSCAVSYSG